MTRLFSRRSTDWFAPVLSSGRSKFTSKSIVYTHRDVQKVLAQLSAAKIDRLSAVPVHEFDRSFVNEIAGLIERRSTLSISVTERELYLGIRGRTFIATIVEHRA